MAATKRESDEETGRRASKAVLCFYLVGVPAVMLVERLECQAVIPVFTGPPCSLV
jgi:hypothetical protein